MEEITVVIPVNFTDAGRLFGLLMRILPFGLLWRIGIVSAVTVITGGFALIGIGDMSLLEFLKQYIRFKRQAKILTYKGCKK